LQTSQSVLVPMQVKHVGTKNMTRKTPTKLLQSANAIKMRYCRQWS